MSGAKSITINQATLVEWLDSQHIEEGPISETEYLVGGTQNILFGFKRGARRMVLRRPPEVLRANSNKTMRRESRLLAALAHSDVPHPKLIAACDDEDVLGAAFYVMERVEGFSPTERMPSLHRGSPSIRRAMGFALVDGVVALSRVDYRAAGLGDFGRTDNFLERQVVRWSAQLDSYGTCQNWPGAGSLPYIEDIVNYLDENIPENFQAGIIHGDYSLGNVLYENDGPGIAAIVDWELSTIGDPLLDLAWAVATWPGDGQEALPVLSVSPSDGFPTSTELIDYYATVTGRDMSEFNWYVVLACFKFAVIVEGSFARACAGEAPMDTGAKLHDLAVVLMRKARRRLG